MYDKFLSLKNRIEQKLSALENRMKHDTGKVKPCPEESKNVPELIQNTEVAKKPVIEPVKDMKFNERIREQSLETEALKEKLKSYEMALSLRDEKIRMKEENLAVFINNLGNKMKSIEDEKHALETKYVEQKNISDGYVEDLKFLKLELETRSKKENEYDTQYSRLKNKLNEKDEEIILLFSRIKNLENERNRLIEEIRKIKIKNIITEEVINKKNNKSIIGKTIKWLSNPMIEVGVNKG
jgi:chromosome segregation ATPase